MPLLGNYGPPPIDENHPSLLMVNAMVQAGTMRTALIHMLTQRKVKQLNAYRLVVDFTPRESTHDYAFSVRVYRTAGATRMPVLSYWANTRDEVLSEENLALLLVLYNS